MSHRKLIARICELKTDDCELNAMSESLQYPIGRFSLHGPATSDCISRWIHEIEELPAVLREAVGGLSDWQLGTLYRPEGWTLRQVVHHLADSHINSFVRFKLALTEDEPTIKPYDEARWAELHDGRDGDIQISLALLESLHSRWVMLLRSLTPKDLARTFIHPERGTVTLRDTIALYAWHGRHHVAHITGLRTRMGW
jgi:hypothetical protein